MSTSARRATAVTGATFTVLLLVSAGMASVPGGSDPPGQVAAFYVAHTAVIVVAQLLGLLAAAVLVLFARALSTTASGPRALRVRRWGYAVAAAAVLTALPVLALCAVAGHGSAGWVHALAVASDWTDVVLFAAIAGLGVSVAQATARVWVRGLAAVVAVLSAARAVLLALGASALEVTAPVGFVVLVMALSVTGLGGPTLRHDA